MISSRMISMGLRKSQNVKQINLVLSQKMSTLNIPSETLPAALDSVKAVVTVLPDHAWYNMTAHYQVLLDTVQVMELDHTFLNSPLCNYFIDVTQSCIENFIEGFAVDPSSIEALECYLIGAVERYDPVSYEKVSPRYQGIWSVLKLQALAVQFISSLVYKRGVGVLSPAFLSLVNSVKKRKDNSNHGNDTHVTNYTCVREEECTLLCKSWDIYAMRGNHESGDVTQILLDLTYENCKDIDFSKVKKLVSAALNEEVHSSNHGNLGEVPELISDNSYLSFFVEFLVGEVLINKFRNYHSRTESVSPSKAATSVPSNQSSGKRSTSVPSNQSSGKRSMTSNQGPNYKKLRNIFNDNVFEKTPAPTPQTTPLKKHITKTEARHSVSGYTEYCHCRGEESGVMVQCEQCGEWYHDVCISLTEQETLNMETYYCTSCSNSDRNLVTK
ncbi:uncharacterized protein LOC134825638 [Bolinopsis microptera]|uniref:uncharacterized protein LOC134825638 n=1 Tax=Bolinopsis microptera TaxID=2820187 RepID=UPI0030799B39